jgi:hypothetical protein
MGAHHSLFLHSTQHTDHTEYITVLRACLRPPRQNSLELLMLGLPAWVYR